jgi:hypothetical protein
MKAQYIIPAALALLVGLLLWQIQKERLVLEYEVIESAPYPREAGTGKYFIVRIQNTGNAKLDNIQFRIALDSGTIESSRFAQPELVKDISHDSSALSGSVPLLNPGEIVSVTITTVGQNEPKGLAVIARAPGATAIPRSNSGFSRELLSTIAALVGAISALVVFAIYRTYKVSDSISNIENLGEASRQIQKSENDLRSNIDQMKDEFEAQTTKLLEERKKREQEWEKREREFEQERRNREEGQPDRQQLIFVIMNRAGLASEFIRFAMASGEISFWRTGLFLLRGFLVDEPNRDRYVSAMEELVSNDAVAMAPSSKGFNLYLLAKMEEYRHNSEKAINWRQRCRSETPLMYEHLIAQDPAYDLDAIRRHLEHN